MLVHIVRPDCRANASLIENIEQEIKVLPPQVKLSVDRILLYSAGIQIFLVHTDMEERNISKNVADLVYKLGAYFIVGVARSQSSVISEPCVMRKREIQFRHRGNSERAKTCKLGFKLVLCKCSLSRKLGMCLILQALVYIYNNKIYSRCTHLFTIAFHSCLSKRNFIDARP